MEAPEPAAAVRQSVNHNVAAGRKTLSTGAIDIPLLRIRDVQCQMVIAVWLVEIDRVNSFRSALITFVFFWADGNIAQRDPICFERIAIPHERQPPRRFFYNDAVSHRIAGKGIKVQVRRRCHADGNKAKQQEKNQKQFQRR